MMYLKFANGMIEIIAGPMFSGKSEELIKRIKILQYTKLKTLVIKPNIEKRWSNKLIFSRAGTSIKTATVSKANQILEKWDASIKVIAIDEIQFFDKDIVNVVTKLANQGVRVMGAGLDKDYLAKPFGEMPRLLAIADKVDKLVAVCVVCGEAATFTFRKKAGGQLIQIGDKEYEARCRVDYLRGMQENKSP